MSSNSPFDDLINEFFELMGLSSDSAPESGVYTLGVDEQLDVFITQDRFANIILFSKVGEISAYGYSEKKYEWLLSRYQVGHPDACQIFAADGDIIFWRSLPIEGLSAQQLITILESFSTAIIDANTKLDVRKPSLSDYENMRQEDIDALPPWAVRG